MKVPKQLAEIPFKVLDRLDNGSKAVVIGVNGKVPTKGFAVGGVVPVQRLPLTTASIVELRAFLLQHKAELFRDPERCFLGVWVDGSDIVLDIVDVLSTPSLAVSLGVSRKEESIYDLASGGEVWLN